MTLESVLQRCFSSSRQLRSRIHVLALLEGGKNSYEHNSSQNCLCYQAENDVDSFTVEIVLPRADAFVLHDHIDGENIEQDEIDEEYEVYECGDFLCYGADGSNEISKNHNP